MGPRIMSQSLSDRGERDDRKSPVRKGSSPNIDREESKVKACSNEAFEERQAQGQDIIWTEPSGQPHGSCLPSTGSANMGNSPQSSSSRETSTQCRKSDEIGENLNSGWRRRQARAYFRKPYPALCFSQSSILAQGSSLIEGRAVQDGWLVLHATRGKTQSDSTCPGRGEGCIKQVGG